MKILPIAIIFSLLTIFIFLQTALAQTSPQNIMQNDNATITKLSSNGAVLMINQTIDKLQFKMGEPIVIHPEMSNAGNNQVFVANGLPLFHVEVRSENGTTIFDSGYSGMLIVGWGFTLGPRMTESDNGTWGSWPKAGAPVIHINTPGKYEILSEANISLYPSSHDFYYNTGHSPLLRLWSIPLEISVLPEKYEPPQLSKSKILPNQTAVVEIENGTSVTECKARPCFNPDKLVIKAGTIVTWINHDIYGHTVTSGMQNDTVIGTNFDSGVIRPGESFNQTFSSQGNFSYFDEVRPWITGEIIVSNTSQYSHLPANYTAQINSSPLKQFQSGIAANKIQCNTNLVLIFKLEDGSPACVTTNTAQKLMERNWTREVTTSNLDVNSSCNGTMILSPNYHAMMFPVLLMQPNTTSCVKLTYTVIRPYGVIQDGVNWPRNETIQFHISDLNYKGDANSFGITQGKDYTNSFNITAFPKTIDHANYPVGSNFTVTYLIRPLPNATGFYDQSIPMPMCFYYPLAVGHLAKEVNSSDFSKGMFTMLNHSCARGEDELVEVEVRGMSYIEMKLQ